jgi:hypothetical protein
MLLFVGAVTLRPPVTSEKEGRTMRCPILKPCVTEGSGIIVTFVILPASGVPTKNTSPYAAPAGADVIVGWAPLKR